MNLKLAVAQTQSINSIDQNIQQILMLLKRIESQNVAAVFFPENCLFFRLQEGESIPFLNLASPEFNPLIAWAKKNVCALHLGSVPLEISGGRFSSSVLIDSAGQLTANYQKMHLFDIQLENHKPIRESDLFSQGQQPGIFKLGDFSFGQTICYDVRFSELFNFYAQKQVDALLVPSAFLVPTGKVHWDVLLKARAIESQSYLIAAAQGGVHKVSGQTGQRETFGNSLVISPWGESIVHLQDELSIASFEISKEAIAKVRKGIPMHNHRNRFFEKGN